MKKLHPFTVTLCSLAAAAANHPKNPLSQEEREVAASTLNDLLKNPLVYDEVTSELVRGDDKSRPFTEEGVITPLGMKIGLLASDVLAEKPVNKTNYAELLLSQSPQGLNELALRSLQLVASRDAQPFTVDGVTAYSKNVQWILSNVLNSKGWRINKDRFEPMTKLGRAYADIDKNALMSSIQQVLNQNAPQPQTVVKTGTKKVALEKAAPFSEPTQA